MDANNIVEVANRGTQTVVLKYGGNEYPVAATGRRVAVPVGAVKRSLGNWDAVDNPERNYHPRTREINRLTTLYGLCGDPFYSDDLTATTAAAAEEHDGRNRAISPERPYNPIDTIDGRKVAMHPNLPHLEVYDLDGNRIVTVLDDPDNTIASGRAMRKVERDSNAAIRAQLDEMKLVQQQLLARLALTDPDAAAEIATTTNDPSRRDLPSLHDETEESAGVADPIASPDAMDVMNEELGLSGPDDADTPTPRPAKKAAAKKAAARKAEV